MYGIPSISMGHVLTDLNGFVKIMFINCSRVNTFIVNGLLNPLWESKMPHLLTNSFDHNKLIIN